MKFMQVVVLMVCAMLVPVAVAQQQGQGEIVMKDVLVLPNITHGGRSWLREDHHENALAFIGTDDFFPLPGDNVSDGPRGAVAWAEASAQPDGWVVSDALRGGYAYWNFESTEARVMILEATGHSMVYVNGLPRVGDPYEAGYVRLPVLVRNGQNCLHFRGARGRVKARLIVAPESGVAINTMDATLGDAPAGQTADWFGAVVVMNATREPLEGLRAVVEGDEARTREIPSIPPLGVRKVVFSTRRSWGEPGERELNLRVVRGAGTAAEVLASAPVRIRVRRPESGEVFKHTFFSRIDGSLQYFAARHATGADHASTGLVLTLHGASVEATNQANAYKPKEDFHIVAPTNRRPYGFDWEDWGRIDAIEVLDIAQKRFPHDPRRVYLTGHSMGGHGAWQLGALFPNRFAAIAPSAGWPTFWTYTERSGEAPWDKNSPESIIGMVHRGTRTSDTLAMVDNYRSLGVYILHGDADDNVPVSQARLMKDMLEKSGHPGFGYHEQPGAGHWWGDECVDYPAIFELFRSRTIPRPSEVADVVFVTADTQISDRLHWVRVEAQRQRLVPTRVEAKLDRSSRTIEAKTDNAAVVAFDIAAAGVSTGITVRIDGEELSNLQPGREGLIRLVQSGGSWKDASNSASPRPAPGPLKRAFDNNFVIVYATRGTEEENRHSLAQARFMAETWWYRGNGSCDVIADDDFNAKPDTYRARNVIVLGNAQINTAYTKVVPQDAPVSVRRGRITAGERVLEEDALAALFVWRRLGEETSGALVGVVGATAPYSMRSLDRTPFFTSGVGFPDVVVLGADMLVRGVNGVRTIGFYGPDATLQSGSVINQRGIEPIESTEGQ